MSFHELDSSKRPVTSPGHVPGSTGTNRRQSVYLEQLGRPKTRQMFGVAASVTEAAAPTLTINVDQNNRRGTAPTAASRNASTIISGTQNQPRPQTQASVTSTSQQSQQHLPPPPRSPGTGRGHRRTGLVAFRTPSRLQSLNQDSPASSATSSSSTTTLSSGSPVTNTAFVTVTSSTGSNTTSSAAATTSATAPTTSANILSFSPSQQSSPAATLPNRFSLDSNSSGNGTPAFQSNLSSASVSTTTATSKPTDNEILCDLFKKMDHEAIIKKMDELFGSFEEQIALDAITLYERLGNLRKLREAIAKEVSNKEARSFLRQKEEFCEHALRCKIYHALLHSVPCQYAKSAEVLSKQLEEYRRELQFASTVEGNQGSANDRTYLFSQHISKLGSATISGVKVLSTLADPSIIKLVINLSVTPDCVNDVLSIAVCDKINFHKLLQDLNITWKISPDVTALRNEEDLTLRKHVMEMNQQERDLNKSLLVEREKREREQKVRANNSIPGQLTETVHSNTSKQITIRPTSSIQNKNYFVKKGIALWTPDDVHNIIKCCLKAKGDPNIKDSNGVPLLHKVVDIRILDLLLNFRNENEAADFDIPALEIDATDNSGYTALHVAVEQRKPKDLMQQLIAHKINIDALSSSTAGTLRLSNATALNLAMGRGQQYKPNLEICGLLLQSGATAQVLDTNQAALANAVETFKQEPGNFIGQREMERKLFDEERVTFFEKMTDEEREQFERMQMGREERLKEITEKEREQLEKERTEQRAAFEKSQRAQYLDRQMSLLGTLLKMSTPPPAPQPKTRTYCCCCSVPVDD